MNRPDYEIFAREMHGDQLHGGRPYWDAHLGPVIRCLDDFGFSGYGWAAKGALHDVIEDCMLDLTPDDRYVVVAGKFGANVGLDVWAVSGFGPNRKTRNACIYEKLMARPSAKPLKCGDRIINVEATIADSSPHYASMYLREREAFAEVVMSGVPEAMWLRLEAGYERLKPIALKGDLRTT